MVDHSNKTELEIAFMQHGDDLSCYNVIQLDHVMRCQYVDTTAHCKEFTYFINYIGFMECPMFGVFDVTRITEVMAMFFISPLALYLLLWIAVIANGFFLPALKSISKKLHINEHLAGVTLLAFGNGVADLTANFNNKNTDMLLTNSLSAAIFTTLVSGGLICYLRPFQMAKVDVVRDILFLILGVMTVELIVTTAEKITIGHAIWILSIYIIYLAVNIFDGYLERGDARSQSRIEILQSRASTPGRYSTVPIIRNSTLRKSYRGTFATVAQREKRAVVNEDATRLVNYSELNEKNRDLFKDFIKSIIPIDGDDWFESGKAYRTILIIRAPLVFLCQILIPVVDVERDKHGWSKLLNCIHIIVTPLVPTVILIKTWYALLELLVTVPLAILIFKDSRTDRPPPYHFAFTLACGIGSIFLIFLCGTEISMILNIIGLTMRLSEGFIRVTISCWGSSLSIVVTNLMLALHGYERMAFASGYGIPFFNLVLSNGIIFIINNVRGNVLSVQRNRYADNAYIFLLLSLISTLVFACAFNYYSRRSVGIFNFMLYTLFVIYAILVEKEVIHSYAMDAIFDLT